MFFFSGKCHEMSNVETQKVLVPKQGSDVVTEKGVGSWFLPWFAGYFTSEGRSSKEGGLPKLQGNFFLKKISFSYPICVNNEPFFRGSNPM